VVAAVAAVAAVAVAVAVAEAVVAVAVVVVVGLYVVEVAEVVRARHPMQRVVRLAVGHSSGLFDAQQTLQSWNVLLSNEHIQGCNPHISIYAIILKNSSPDIIKRHSGNSGVTESSKFVLPKQAKRFW
jgi:hypothetical protein